MTDRPEPLTPEALDTIEARANAATPGPWEAGDIWVFTSPIYEDDKRLSDVLGMPFADDDRADAERQRGLTNAEFIAHAREDVPALVVELRRLHAENEEQGRRIDNLLGEQVAGIGFMRERDALQAKIDAAPHASDCDVFQTGRANENLGFECNCWKSRAALTGEATEPEIKSEVRIEREARA